MDRSNGTAEQYLCELNDVLVALQAIVKCSICCSTLRDPVTPSCSHAFCKECIEGVFQKRSAIECPMCRKVISRRSARTPSEHIGSITSMFLQMVTSFKGELKETNVIPKEKFILESQALTQITDSPLRQINLKESTVTMRKKRKIEVLDVVASKLARIEEVEGFAMPVVPTIRLPAIPQLLPGNEEEKRPVKNKRRGATARTLQLLDPIPDSPRPPVEFSMEKIEVKKEPTGKPPPYPIKTEAPHNLETPKETNENPPSNDISTFFALHPDSRQLFKANLPILLRELGMRPYNEPNTPGHYREGQQTLKFEILLNEDGDYLSDRDSTIPMNNNSMFQTEAIPHPVEPKSMEEVGCQTDELRPEEDEVVPDSEAGQIPVKEINTTGCQTENISEEPCSICRLKMRTDIGCQTDVIPTISLKHENPSPSRYLAKGGGPNEPSEGTVVLDSNRFEENGYPPPKEFVIAVSQRESPNDNVLLQQFKAAFNVKIQTEISSKTTHLVLMNAYYQEYSKPWPISVAIAICRRVEILNRNWIDDCLSKKTLLDTALYKIFGQEYRPWFASPGIQIPQVFNQFRFYIPRKYFPYEQAESRDKLVRLVLLAGGEILNQLAELQTAFVPELSKTLSAMFRFRNRFRAAHEKPTLIIFSPLCQNMDAAYRLRHDFGVEVLNANFILDSVCRGFAQEIEEYLVDRRRPS